VLTGNVSTEVQHELALRIAQSHAGQGSIVDSEEELERANHQPISYQKNSFAEVLS
jgi:hypothetical protein